MRALMSRFRNDCRGGPALEFALIAPVLFALMVGAADIAHITFERSDMLGATRSGTQYFMAGGTDSERAKTIIQGSWSSMPETATISVQRECECGGQSASCNLLCSDQSVPVAYSVIEITYDIDGVFVDYYAAASDKVRVR